MNKIVSKIIHKICFRLFDDDKALYWWLRFTRYHWGWPFEKKKPLVLYALDSKSYGCGFADRLRGMVGAYTYAKHHGLPFAIDHQIPFLLQDYLEPNNYNWIPEHHSLSYNLFVSSPFTILNHITSLRLFKAKRNKQIHIYSNVEVSGLLNWLYCDNYGFSKQYNELFKPSRHLSEAAQPHLKCLGTNYISVSFRFIDLLGDFNEGARPILSKEEQQKLIIKCRQMLENLYKQQTEAIKILVTADSMHFLNSMRDIPYIYIVEGKTGHSGSTTINGEAILKTFLDFYLISQASSVFLGVTGQLYKSNFARTAAMTQDKPFEIIQF